MNERERMKGERKEGMRDMRSRKARGNGSSQKMACVGMREDSGVGVSPRQHELEFKDNIKSRLS